MPQIKAGIRKKEIIKAAQHLFKKEGYAATSMRDIGRKVQLDASSIYSHFQSKEEILEAICQEIGKAFQGLKNSVKQQESDASFSLKAIIRGHVQIITNNLEASAVFLHEWRYLSKSSAQSFITMRNDYENFIKQIIQSGKQSGQFKEIDEKFTTLMILSSLNWIYSWYNPSGKMTANELSNQLINLLFEGIQKT